MDTKNRDEEMAEYVLLEPEDQENWSKNHTFEKVGELRQSHFSIYQRILFFAIGLFIGFLTLLFGIVTIVFGILSALAPAKYHQFKDEYLKFLKKLKNSAAISVGLLIAALFPPLGIGFILLYFDLMGEIFDQEDAFRINRFYE